MTERESVYIEALCLMDARPPSWWFRASLYGEAIEAIHEDGWFDSCEAALAAGREWAQAKGYEVLPIRAEDGNEEE